MAKPLPSYLFSGNQLRSSLNSLADVVKRGLMSVEDQDRTGRIYASDGGLCERAGVLKASTKTTLQHSATMRVYAELGNAIEKIVVDSLASQGLVLFRQYHLPDVNLNLGGYVDAVIVHKGGLWVLEVKSCSSLPKEPKPLHATQAAAYSAIMGLPAIVYYQSRSVANYKNELSTTEFELPAGAQLQRDVIWRIAYANLAYQAKVLPKIPMHMADADDCGYCPFVPFCWSGETLSQRFPDVTPSKHQQLSAQATAIMEHLMDPAVVADRRVGILNHIAKHGGPTAKRVLVGRPYDDLLTSPEQASAEPTPSTIRLESD